MSVHSVGLHVTGKDIRSCVEEAELAGMLCFQNMQNLLIRHEVLGQFLSDFVRIKRNVFPRLSTLIYLRKFLTELPLKQKFNMRYHHTM